MADTIQSIDGLYNFRDLGGIQTHSGHIAPGLLFRSEALAGLSQKGRQELEASPVGLVLDLRASSEAAMMPDPQLNGIDNVHIPMLEGAMPESDSDVEHRVQEQMDAAALLRQTYLSMIANNADAYVEIVHRTAQAAQAGKGTLIHCSAGKDRTGTSIAFILTLAGALREQVVADYASSQKHLEGPWMDSMLQAIEQAGVTVPDNIKPMMVITPASLMEEILDKLQAEYGGVESYLLQHGAQAADIEQIRQSLQAD